jgi:hypothetical protein
MTIALLSHFSPRRDDATFFSAAAAAVPTVRMRLSFIYEYKQTQKDKTQYGIISFTEAN